MAGRATIGIWQYAGDWYAPKRQTSSGYARSSVSAIAYTRVSHGYATGVVVANGYYNSVFDAPAHFRTVDVTLSLTCRGPLVSRLASVSQPVTAPGSGPRPAIPLCPAASLRGRSGVRDGSRHPRPQ